MTWHSNARRRHSNGTVCHCYRCEIDRAAERGVRLVVRLDEGPLGLRGRSEAERAEWTSLYLDDGAGRDGER